MGAPRAMRRFVVPMKVFQRRIEETGDVSFRIEAMVSYQVVDAYQVASYAVWRCVGGSSYKSTPYPRSMQVAAGLDNMLSLTSQKSLCLVVGVYGVLQ